MKLVLYLMLAAVLGCKEQLENAQVPTPALRDILADGELVYLAGNYQGFVLMPTANQTSPIKWVWYAPTLLANGGTPMAEQHAVYFDQLRANGYAIIGVDVGESFGSPYGRAGFQALYNYLLGHNFELSGVFILQSRGALMGYTYLLEHPTVAKAVVGIYPLLTFNDYVGPQGMAPAWGLSEVDFNLISPNSDPALNASQFNFPIYHIHGDADVVVHLEPNQQFVATAPNAVLDIFPNLGHEFYSNDFFANPDVINFIQLHGSN